MKKILVAATLLSTCLTVPAQAKERTEQTNQWWCAPSGMTLFTPIMRAILGDCTSSRPMDR